ncbi:50S ribosomal protein L21 [Allofrancisella guangzhouensis]|uniref:Large ribosomal subunit protein bL21 n=1 Tax=Allofrancisella guangzhouensis TaxID=594679 RepID=A0A0A8E5K3_9GAMM|nr:50S ribosomal protein L21 [Allofrancisella guangzhouensis]AJC49239.1 50S ribosomal protein L21 [Allofrancisella guangzhouensis]MBK2027678.1 50S ribosomal protein L21 [Allofrancisella guangzhouensis]MBK2044908.1 50S ribosomal protein L21 [Allofrancisella guangzhouensis]MBK2046433.1 50S ribosomal protein L21 [Allofrancisella guangzhouensis]
MYAIIKSGGKQYKVKQGEVVKLEKLDLGIGEKIEFDTILMGQTIEGEVKIGAPVVEGAKVVAEVVEQGRNKKVKIMKFRRRKHSMKQQGHRQYFTAVKVSSISL